MMPDTDSPASTRPGDDIVRGIRPGSAGVVFVAYADGTWDAELKFGRSFAEAVADPTKAEVAANGTYRAACIYGACCRGGNAIYRPLNVLDPATRPAKRIEGGLMDNPLFVHPDGVLRREPPPRPAELVAGVVVFIPTAGGYQRSYLRNYHGLPVHAAERAAETFFNLPLPPGWA